MFKIKNKIVSEILEWALCFLIAFVLYLIINYFFGTVSGVKQVSMKPTTVEGDRLLIKRPTIFKQELKYGDIVTLEAPIGPYEYVMEPNRVLEGEEATATYTEHKGISKFLYSFVGIGKISYIKRVIGLSGDHIEIKDDGYVYRNGEKLEETYTKDGTTSQNGKYINLIVPENTIYVMGDNRLESKDSRYFGCIPIDKVDGYVITRVWPITKWGNL